MRKPTHQAAFFIGAGPLDGSSAEPLYAQLADRLAQAISSGALAPGQQLPPEAALGESYGISRVTVRQALALLVRSGQLVARRGKGTFVAKASFQQDLSSLQGFQEALRAQGVEPQTELLEFSTSAGRTDSSPPSELNLPLRLRRRYLIDGEPFAVVEAYLPSEAAAVGKVRAQHLAVYDILQQFMGLRIARADVAIECARPKPKVSAELGLPRGSHVLLMRRTSYVVTGAACEHMRIYIVPERYTFRMSVPGPMQLATAIVQTEMSTT
jgi:GntR family transcriptional regulator